MSLIYRPPNEGNNTLFENQPKHILSKNDVQNKQLHWQGDFNLCLFDYEENNKACEFVNLMFNFGIISNINKATRGKQHYTTKIDFIHTNSVLDTKIQKQLFNRCS